MTATAVKTHNAPLYKAIRSGQVIRGSELALRGRFSLSGVILRGPFGPVSGETGVTRFEDVVGADQFDQAQAFEVAPMSHRNNDEGECDINLSEVLLKFGQSATRGEI